MPNFWMGIGRLTKDPVLKEINQGKSVVVNFYLAINRGHDGKTDFVPCSAWNSTAKYLIKYAHKGDELYACGRFESNGHYYSILIQELHFLKGVTHTPHHSESNQVSSNSSSKSSSVASTDSSASSSQLSSAPRVSMSLDSNSMSNSSTANESSASSSDSTSTSSRGSSNSSNTSDDEKARLKKLNLPF